MKGMQKKKQSPATHDINGTMSQDNLKQLMKHQKTRLRRGETDANICMIEFQKKGLPHAHILQFLGTYYKKRFLLIIIGI